MRKGIVKRGKLLIAVTAGIMSFCSVAYAYVLLNGSAPLPVTKFPHAPHANATLQCIDCHENMEKSTALSARHLPKEERCLTCHEKGETKEDCALCHVDPVNPSTYPGKVWDIRFSHQLHLQRNIECRKCHETSYTATSPGEIEPPKMALCYECHGGTSHVDACDFCHTDVNAIKPADHTENWMRRHKSKARTNLSECGDCHSPNYCIRCHFGKPKLIDRNGEHVESGFIHSGDWIARHTGAARKQMNMCFSCHQIETCSECHNNFGKEVSFKGGVHPVGWLDPTSKQFHGKKARVNPAACAACHETGSKDEDPSCMECHGKGGLNPHPKDWKDHITKMGGLLHSDPEMCYRCHDRRGDKKLCRKCHDDR